MKKIYLLFAVAMMTVAAFAQTTINVSDYFTEKTNNPEFTTTDGEFTFKAEKAGASNVPIFSLGYNGADNDIRNYANGSFTFTSKTKTIKALQFVMSTQGLKQWAKLDASVGAATADKSAGITTWQGSEQTITFTVGANNDYGTNTAKSAGQFDFKQIIVYVEGDPDPEIPETQELALTIDTVIVDPEYFEEYGDVMFQVIDIANDVFLIFDAYTSAADDYDGTYTTEDESLDPEYTYVVLGALTGDGDEVTALEANLKITTNGDQITLEGNILGDNNVNYTFSFTGAYGIYNPDPYQYEPDEATTINETSVELDYYGDYISEYGYAEIYLYTENGFFDLAYVASAAAENTEMPLEVGTYEFTNVPQKDGDFIASEGYDADYEYDYPSFYGVYSDDEGHYDDTYYLASGTVTVAINGNLYTITVDAISAKGSKVKVTYTYEMEDSAVETVEATTGSSKIFNVLGMEVGKNHKNAILIQNGKKFILR